jgi:CheY-like chemotaxis protein
VLIDARMPELDGIEATRLIKGQMPPLTMIVLSMVAEYQAAAFMAGADAFIRKDEPPERLLVVLAEAARSMSEPRDND